MELKQLHCFFDQRWRLIRGYWIPWAQAPNFLIVLLTLRKLKTLWAFWPHTLLYLIQFDVQNIEYAPFDQFILFMQDTSLAWSSSILLQKYLLIKSTTFLKTILRNTLSRQIENGILTPLRPSLVKLWIIVFRPFKLVTSHGFLEFIQHLLISGEPPLTLLLFLHAHSLDSIVKAWLQNKLWVHLFNQFAFLFSLKWILILIRFYLLTLPLIYSAEKFKVDAVHLWANRMIKQEVQRLHVLEVTFFGFGFAVGDRWTSQWAWVWWIWLWS